MCDECVVISPVRDSERGEEVMRRKTNGVNSVRFDANGVSPDSAGFTENAQRHPQEAIEWSGLPFRL